MAVAEVVKVREADQIDDQPGDGDGQEPCVIVLKIVLCMRHAMQRLAHDRKRDEQ